jgi:hypothetical protein
VPALIHGGGGAAGPASSRARTGSTLGARHYQFTISLTHAVCRVEGTSMYRRNEPLPGMPSGSIAVGSRAKSLTSNRSNQLRQSHRDLPRDVIRVLVLGPQHQPGETDRSIDARTS